MFSLRLRILLAVLGTAYGLYKLANGQQSAVVLLLAVGLLVFGYFRYGAIRPAFMAMQRGDLNTARKHFNTIKFPKWLSAESSAYFHWVNAVLTLEDSGNTDLAEGQMQRALDGKLRTSHDRCLATTVLAQIVAKRGDADRAAQLLDRAEQIPHHESAEVYLREVKSQLCGAT